ncbi:hypothetical protein [Mesorhizobium sp. M0130]
MMFHHLKMRHGAVFFHRNQSVTLSRNHFAGPRIIQSNGDAIEVLP